MSDSDLKQYVQKLIEPLYLKIQQLDKQNNDLKKRVGCLESQIITQTTRTYMKNTASRQHHIQQSKISIRDNQNRSVSGGKEKPGWKSITKIQEPKPVNKEPVHHQKLKLKPPIPRMNSKTPTKTTESIIREKSPPVQRKIISGSKIGADKKQNNSQTQPAPSKQQAFTTPARINGCQKDLGDSSQSKLSKGSSIQLGKPNIYIQKQAKLNSISNTPRQTPPLQRSSLTQKTQNKTAGTTPSSESEKMTKSQLSIK